jgi:hypothetical protein
MNNPEDPEIKMTMTKAREQAEITLPDDETLRLPADITLESLPEPLRPIRSLGTPVIQVICKVPTVGLRFLTLLPTIHTSNAPDADPYGLVTSGITRSLEKWFDMERNGLFQTRSSIAKAQSLEERKRFAEEVSRSRHNGTNEYQDHLPQFRTIFRKARPLRLKK